MGMISEYGFLQVGTSHQLGRLYHDARYGISLENELCQ
jgi:hypothetical protein